MNKKISIIVPIYKSESFLPKLIESVLNQTCDSFELILADNGSPDSVTTAEYGVSIAKKAIQLKA